MMMGGMDPMMMGMDPSMMGGMDVMMMGMDPSNDRTKSLRTDPMMGLGSLRTGMMGPNPYGPDPMMGPILTDLILLNNNYDLMTLTLKKRRVYGILLEWC